MNDEIKEILDYWKFYINEPCNYKLLNIHFDEINKVLDYITNLQQENETLKDLSFDYQRVIAKKEEEKNNLIFEQDKFVEEHKMINEYLKDYKSRCEKANEFINENTELEHDGDDYGYMEWINIINMDTMTFINNLSDILNGRSDE